MLGIANNRLRFTSALPLLLCVSMLAACTWVKSTPQAELVRIVPADRIADCRELAELSVYTMDKVAGVKRKAAKVQEELETLARVEAAEMSADTIVAASEVSEGRQKYIAYRCQ